MSHQERIEQLFKDYEVAGLIDGNTDKIISYLADEIVGIGMGEQGFVSSHEQVREILASTKRSTALLVMSLNTKICLRTNISKYCKR